MPSLRTRRGNPPPSHTHTHHHHLKNLWTSDFREKNDVYQPTRDSIHHLRHSRADSHPPPSSMTQRSEGAPVKDRHRSSCSVRLVKGTRLWSWEFRRAQSLPHCATGRCQEAKRCRRKFGALLSICAARKEWVSEWVSELVSWYFEPSQPQGITSKLRTMFNLSLIYSARKSSDDKLNKNH